MLNVGRFVRSSAFWRLDYSFQQLLALVLIPLMIATTMPASVPAQGASAPLQREMGRIAPLDRGPVTADHLRAPWTNASAAVPSSQDAGGVPQSRFVMQPMTTVVTPTFSPAAGTYNNNQSVTISTTTQGTTIYYTTNGNTPSCSGTQYTAPVTVSVTETIKAIGCKSGYTNSSVGSATYTMVVANPTFSPVAGTYNNNQTVTISTTTSGASIRYTTDGTTTPSPTVGTLYSGAITVSATTTVKAIAYQTGWTSSSVISATYTMVAANPTFSPVAGTYNNNQTVTISTATSTASIRYTIDGSTPSATVGTVYSGAINVSATTTVKAIAYETGWTSSSVVSATYTMVVANPAFSPVAGTYTGTQTVAISTVTSGASIYYTADSSTPTQSSPAYVSPIPLIANTTLKAIAYKTGMTTSGVSSAAYTIQPDFTLGSIPASVQVAQGGAASFTITATPVNGFTGTISLSVSGLPSGVTGSFNPTTVPGSGGSAALNLTVSSSTAAGTYPLTVTGVSGSSSHNLTVTLVVLAPALYEAEAPANQLAGGAAVVACAPCSGGHRVDNIGHSGSANGTLTFPNINASTAGTYALTVYYTNGDVATRSANISVNGSGSPLSISAPITGSWTTVSSVTANVILNSGTNTIQFSNPASPAPAIDRITLVNTATCSQTASDVVLVIDNSGSMGVPFPAVKAASQAFVDSLQLNSDQAALVSFNTTATTNQTLTHTGSLVKTAIAALSATGNTAISTGIDAARAELASARHNASAQKVIVLLSDGVDSPASGDTATINSANTAKTAGIRLITIAFGAANTAFIQSLASSSSDYYASPTTNEMAAVYSSIACSICRTPDQAPAVDAGPDQAVTIPSAANLAGTMSDDGLPQGSTLTATWSKLSGPGTVTFANPNAAATTATFNAGGTYVLQLTASDGQLNSSDTVAVTVTAPVISVSISPTSATLFGTQTQVFTATVTGTSNQNVSWGADLGTIDANGTYHPPTTITSQQQATVTVTSQADSTKHVTAPVTLMPPVSVSPATATLYGGRSQQFISNQAVTWSLTGIGTLDTNSGLYTAPATITTLQNVTVTAKSPIDQTQLAPAVITLAPTLCTTTSYEYDRAIVVDHTKVPNTDQTNFPLLVNITDPLLATTSHGGHVANVSGYDILFASDPAGANKLDHEIESYNPITGQILMWVRIPTLSHTADTTIYLLYGNNSITASQENRAGVWDPHFGGVWHLGGNGGAPSTLDSTSNGNNATIVGAASAVASQIGNGAALGGNPNYIDAGSSPSVSPTHMGTLSIWVKYNALSNWTTPIGNGNTYWDTNGVVFWDDGGGTLAFEVNGPSSHSRVYGSGVATGTWYYLAGTWDGSTVSLYQNGALAGSTAQTIDASPAYHLTFGVDGALSDDGDFLNGVLNEARVSNVARSADWIATEYNNQNSPATFYAVSAENTAATAQAIGITPTTVALSNSQTQQFVPSVFGACIGLTWTLSPPTGGGTVDANGLYTAPANILTQQTVTLTAAIQGSSATSPPSTILLVPPVIVTPATAILTASMTQQFAANQPVTWSVSPLGAGQVSAGGLYTAPSIIGLPTATITAKSVADPALSTSVPVTLSSAVPILHVTPQTGAIYQPGQTVILAIGVQNAGTADASGTTIHVVNPDSSVSTLAAFPVASGHTSSQQTTYTIPTIPPPPAPMPLPLDTGVSLFGVNLIVNGNGEAALGADSDNVAASVPGWNRTGNFTTVQWEGPGGFPNQVIPGPVNRGANFFAGGPNNGFSSAYQDIDVSSAASAIDGASVQYDFSAYLGGYASQGDNAVITADFKNTAGTILATITLGPLTSYDRHNSSGLWPRSATGSLPAGTRTITVTMNMTRQDGSYNDGYADNLALVLAAPSSYGGTDAANVAYLDALRAADDRSLPFAVQTSWQDPGGRNYGPTTTQAQTTEILPIVTVALSAATDIISGKTLTYTATMANTGHATALGIAASITLPDGTVQALSLPATTLAPQASMQATASFVVGLSQASSTLFARAAVTWADSPGNSYGPLLSNAATDAVQFASLLQNATFTAAPAAPGPYITGTAQTFSVTLADQNGTPVSGTTVTFTVSGANTASATATTDANGRAAFTYTGANNGIDNVQGSINLGAALLTSNGLPVTWVTPVAALSTTPLAGNFYSGDGTGVFSATSATAVAFTQAFPTLGFNAPAGTVLNNTSGTSGATGSFTDVATDIAGNYSGVLPTQAGTGTLASFQAAFQGSLLVKTAGSVTFTVYADNGFVFGVGNGAVAVSGPNVNPPASGATALAGLPVMGVYNQAGVPAGGLTLTVSFPQPGTYPYEIDYATTGTGSPVLTLASSANSGRIVPAAGALLLTPLAPLPQSPGGTEVVTVNLTDVMGHPVANQTVALTVTGANPNFLMTHYNTDANGNVTYSYVGANAGVDTLQAATPLGGNMLASNVVTVTWGGQQAPGGPVLSITSAGTVTLPNSLLLTGTVTGLAPGSTFTAAWQQVNGPGTATFTTPNQATTQVSFSAAGTYVLQLSATSNGLLSTAQVTVIVNPQPNQEPGWIGGPAYGGMVSGVVPIVLASGVTLQSGTLSYYSASNQGAAVVLNATTTGSGQIGTLDTTQLRNGEYWIELVATDSTGHTQTNLTLVTVVGDYKPGRVTATVADLVVPAKGLAIKIQRTYDSLNKDRVGEFGYGWSLAIRVDLEVGPTGDVTFTLGGKRRTFSFTPQYVFPPTIAQVPLFLPAYTPEPGLHGTLAPSGPGCMLGPYSLWDMLIQYGSTFVCDTGGSYGPPAYVYTDPSGTQYTMGADGTLISIRDLNGNTLTVEPLGIISSTGQSVHFWRNGAGPINWIQDPAGSWYNYLYDGNGNLVAVVYPGNNPAPTTNYTYYDAPAHLYKSGTDARNNPLPTAAYDANGRLQSVTDALNQTTSYSYNLATNTTTTTYPDTGAQTVQYDAYGMVLSTTDPLQHTTTNVYDANHNLTSTTDPLNHTTSYTYDPNGNQASVTNPLHKTRYTVYNQYSEPDGTQDELGNVVAYAYDANFLPSSVIDHLDGTPTVLASFTFNPDGTMHSGAIGYDLTVSPEKATQYTYDGNGNMLNKTDALGRQTSFTYDALDRKATQTDPSTALTTFHYDALSNLTSTNAPLGRITSSQYDLNGNKTSDTDANGHTTGYQYDALNRLWIITYPTAAPNTVTRTYDFRGNLLDETDQATHVTHHEYDLAGRLTTVTKAYGTTLAATTSYTYYDDNRKHTETDPRGNTTTYAYDDAGRLTAVTDAKTETTHYGYDDAGNQTSITDAKGHTTQFQYDCRKRLRKTIYNDTTFTTNTYDGPGNLASVTDQAGNTVQYTYDAANQLASVIQVNHPDPAHNTTSYAYDPNGNLLTSTDANGHLTQTPYNALNELTSTALPDGALTETRTYDYAGNLFSLLNFNGKTTGYGYDPQNRLLSKTPDPTLNETAESFTYTATGKRAAMTDTSGLTSYGYDTLDRLTSKATQWGTLSYTYDSAGNVATMTSSNTNGISVGYTYDELNRLASVVDNHLTANHNTTSYTYDPASNLGTVTYPNGLSSTFQYDTLNRLTALNGYSYQLGATGNRQSATEPGGRAANWSYDGIYRLTNETDSAHGVVSYGLDPVGNRLSQTSSIAGIPTGSFGYDADDRLSTEQYDNNGNTIVSGARTFAYDFENRLKSMNNGAVTLLYDADGNRVGKNTTRYLVDDLNPTGYAQVVEELTGSTVTRRYTYGLQRISQTQSGTTSFYGYDGFGSVRQLTDTTGAVTDTYDYDAWGNTVNVTGSTPNVYRYRGEQYDPDLNLYYLRARYFNPLTGRFLSRDPADGERSDPRTLNKYLYAGGDPVNATDPSGRNVALESALLQGSLALALFSNEIARQAIMYGPAACEVFNQAWTLLQLAAGQREVTWDTHKGPFVLHIEPPETILEVFQTLSDWCAQTGT
jgi:RHS repeat-associated protein